MLVHETLYPLAESNTAYDSAANVNSASGSKTYSPVKTMDVPRAIRLGFTISGSAGGSYIFTATVNGKSVTGATISDVVTFNNSQATTTVSGYTSRAFASVSSISWTRNTGTSISFTMDVGRNSRFGLTHALRNGSSSLYRVMQNRAIGSSISLEYDGAPSDGRPLLRAATTLASDPASVEIWYDAKLPESELVHEHLGENTWSKVILGRE